MAFWGEDLRFSSEKFFTGKKNRRYTILNNRVFRKLSDLRVRVTKDDSRDDGVNQLYFNQDITEIETSDHFGEAIKHLNIDLPDYLSDLNELKLKVNEI